MKLVYWIIFSLILFIGIIARVYQVENIPPSLNWDEVSIGYNAYSLVNTGKDEWGFGLPLNFRAFGDYKLPLYIYSDVPFVALMGPTPLAIKFPSILAGIGTAIFIFLILKKITQNIQVSLVGMLIASLLPWSIILSRIALEANLALFLITASIYFLISKTRYSLIYSSLLMGFALFSYNSVRVLAIPLIILVAFYLKGNISSKKTLSSLAIFLLFLILAFYQGLFIDSAARYKWITLLDEGAILKINSLRGQSSLSPLLNHIVYNKLTYFFTEASKNYFSHFSPDFLFINGGSQYQFSIPGSGLIYWAMLPLFILGLIRIVIKKRREELFFLGLLLITPLPGAITRDAPHALRSLFMVTPLVIISILGLDLLKERVKPKVLFAVVLVILIATVWQFNNFWTNYSSEYRIKYSWSWQYGYQQAVDFIKQEGGKYNQIVITKKYGEPHIFLLFYSTYDPSLYQNDPTLVRYKKSDWYWVDGFGEYRFVNDWEIKQKHFASKTLLITDPGNFPPNAKVIKSINFLSGDKAFDIVSLE